VRRRLPNAITCLRLLLLPAIVRAVQRRLPVWAVGLLLASALSDILDGYLARRWKVESAFGRLFDPLADKLTQFTALVLLSMADGDAFTPVPVLFVAVILARDLFLVYGALRVRRRCGRVEIRPRLVGRASTALVFVELIASASAQPRPIVDAIAWGTVPLVVAAGIAYARDGLRQVYRR